MPTELVCVPRAELERVLSIARAQVGTGDSAVQAVAEAMEHGGRTAPMTPPGEPPYGFKWDGRRLVEVPAERVVIEVMWAERRAGLSFREIATGLNSQNVPSPRGGFWSGETVRRVLNRDMDGSGRDGR